jgi:hypothetical protein
MQYLLNIKTRVGTLIAVTISSAAVAVATPANASASVTFSDGSSATVVMNCRTYGLGSSNVDMVLSANRAGTYWFRYLNRSYPSWQWSAWSRWLPVGSTPLVFPTGKLWQFWVEVAHLLPNGVWDYRGEYAFVTQNGFNQGYGAGCAT